MEAKEAVHKAKEYISYLYDEEQVTNLGLEEVEHHPSLGTWEVTMGFSCPWNTPRSRAQEVLENLGAVSGLKRSYKIITLSEDGSVLSMKNRTFERSLP